MWQIEETLRLLFKDLENIYGSLDFVALIPNEGDPNLVDVLVSADWLPKSDKESATFFVENVLNRLDRDDLLQISSIIPIRQASYLGANPEQLELLLSKYYNIEKNNITILIPEEAQSFRRNDGRYYPKDWFLGIDGIYHPPGSFLGVDSQYHPPGSFLGVDSQYHPKGQFMGVDSQYHPPGSFLGVDSQYHPKGWFLGVDSQYHPPGSFLGVDSKYHPKGWFLGVDSQYHPPGSFLGVDSKYHPKGSYLGINGEFTEPH